MNTLVHIYCTYVHFPWAPRVHRQEYFQTKLRKTQFEHVQYMGPEQQLQEMKPEDHTGLEYTTTGAEWKCTTVYMLVYL